MFMHKKFDMVGSKTNINSNGEHIKKSQNSEVSCNGKKNTTEWDLDKNQDISSQNNSTKQQIDHEDAF